MAPFFRVGTRVGSFVQHRCSGIDYSDRVLTLGRRIPGTWTRTSYCTHAPYGGPQGGW